MNVTKEELTDLAELVRSNPDKQIALIVKGFWDYHSVNSTRRSERRAIGSNSKANELCDDCPLRKDNRFITWKPGTKLC